MPQKIVESFVVAPVLIAATERIAAPAPDIPPKSEAMEFPIPCAKIRVWLFIFFLVKDVTTSPLIRLSVEQITATITARVEILIMFEKSAVTIDGSEPVSPEIVGTSIL